jgi:hypothetical protein
MWIFTQDGFVSAVNNGQVPGKLAVRARDKEALELLSLSTGSEIEEFKGTDYEYRVHVTREDFNKWLTMHVDTLDYSNFKSRIWASRGEVYHDACSDVWQAMLAVSDKRKTRRIGR